LFIDQIRLSFGSIVPFFGTFALRRTHESRERSAPERPDFRLEFPYREKFVVFSQGIASDQATNVGTPKIGFNMLNETNANNMRNYDESISKRSRNRKIALRSMPAFVHFPQLVPWLPSLFAI